VTGDVIAPATRTLQRNWRTQVETGTDRIRAGFPAGWISGDKTGTGMNETKHTYVDLAFGGPAGAPPIIVAAYFEPERRTEEIDPISTGALAQVGRLAARTYR
jgi:beta-lactamase class A